VGSRLGRRWPVRSSVDPLRGEVRCADPCTLPYAGMGAGRRGGHGVRGVVGGGGFCGPMGWNREICGYAKALLRRYVVV